MSHLPVNTFSAGIGQGELELTAALGPGPWYVADETPRPRVVGPSVPPRQAGWSRPGPEGEWSLLDSGVPTGDLLGFPLEPESTWAAPPTPVPRRRAPRGRSAERWAASTPGVSLTGDLVYRSDQYARSQQAAWEVPQYRERAGRANASAPFDDELGELPRHRYIDPATSGHDYLVGTKPRRYHGGPERGAPSDVGTAGGSNDPEKFPLNLGVGTEWRLTSMDKDMLMVQALERITSALQNVGASAPAEPEIEFSGRPAEDPGLFLRSLEQWFLKMKTPEARWRSTMRRCLKGSAYTWYTDIQDQEWPLIKALFVQRWDSVALKGNLRRRLFGESQRPDERVAPFIMEKWALFRRLSPETSEGDKIETIIELLFSDIRRHCRGGHLDSLERLIQFASQIEADLQEGRKSTQPRTGQTEGGGWRNEPRGPPGNAARQPQQARPPPQARPRQAAPGTVRERYPCRWCGSRDHIDPRCPRVGQRPAEPQPGPRTGGPQPQPRAQAVAQGSGGNDARATATAPASR